MRLAVRVLVLAGFVLTVAGFAGCSETQQNSNQSHASTIPWNRPEKWEGTGALGGFNNAQ